MAEISKATDVELFKGVVARHEGKVAGVVHSLIKNMPLAEDIGQEVFLKLYDSQHKFPRKGSLNTYLIRQVIDICERAKRSNSFGQHDGPIDFSQKLESKFFELSPEFQLVVVLRLIEGYSIEETAEILRTTTSTVLSQLASAQHELRLGLHRKNHTMEGALSDQEALLLKSMDVLVDEIERTKLAQALKQDSFLKSLNDQYNQLREMLHRKEKATFGPFFSVRIVHAINQRKENIDYVALSFFKKYQLLVLGIVVALFILNLVVAEDFSFKAIFGLDQQTPEDVYSIDVYKNLPQ